MTMKECCTSAEKLKEYLKLKARGHNSYKCYSRIERIRPIIQEKVLYLNNGQGWNDITDRTNFNRDRQDRINLVRMNAIKQETNYNSLFHLEFSTHVKRSFKVY